MTWQMAGSYTHRFRHGGGLYLMQSYSPLALSLVEKSHKSNAGAAESASDTQTVYLRRVEGYIVREGSSSCSAVHHADARPLGNPLHW